MKLHELEHLVRHIKQRSRKQKLAPGGNIGDTDVHFYVDGKTVQMLVPRLHEPIEHYLNDKGVFLIPLYAEDT